LYQKYSLEKLKVVGTYFGIGESGVSKACWRLKNVVIKKDKKLLKNYIKLN